MSFLPWLTTNGLRPLVEVFAGWIVVLLLFIHCLPSSSRRDQTSCFLNALKTGFLYFCMDSFQLAAAKPDVL